MNIDDYRTMKANNEAKAEAGDKPTEQPTAQAEVVTKPDEVVEPVKPTTEKPEAIEINGKEVTIEELKNGYFRQSDYTKKTQELKRERNKVNDAVNVAKMIQSNPELQKVLKEHGADASKIENITLASQQVKDLQTKIATMELDSTLKHLKSKYDDFNEVEVIKKASELHTDDLEFVYLGLNGSKPIAKQKAQSPSNEISAETIVQQVLQQIQGTQQMSVPQTLMKGKGVPSNIQNVAEPISATEAKIAKHFGMTPEAYRQYQ